MRSESIINALLLDEIFTFFYRYYEPRGALDSQATDSQAIDELMSSSPTVAAKNTAPGVRLDGEGEQDGDTDSASLLDTPESQHKLCECLTIITVCHSLLTLSSQWTPTLKHLFRRAGVRLHGLTVIAYPVHPSPTPQTLSTLP